MFKKLSAIIILFIGLSSRVFAGDQILAQYQVTNLNSNEQIASILNGIENYSANKIIITYAGALFYLANDVKVAISENNNNIPIELESINPQYNLTNGSVIVSLINNSELSQKNNNQDTQSHGDFFNYTTSESGFFKY